MQDLPRTFPGHLWLDTPEGHAALRRVLVGYSFRDSDVGYCQVDSFFFFFFFSMQEYILSTFFVCVTISSLNFNECRV